LASAFPTTPGFSPMNTPIRAWFSVSRPGEGRLRCAACGFDMCLADLVGDHHPRYCPNCRTESVYFDWHDQVAQILVESAPIQLQRLIRWTQDNLDELEFTELLCSLEELAAGLQAARSDDQ